MFCHEQNTPGLEAKKKSVPEMCLLVLLLVAVVVVVVVVVGTSGVLKANKLKLFKL